MTNKIKEGQTYSSMYIDGTIADTFYVTSIKDETAQLNSVRTGKRIKITLSKMQIDMQHGQLKLKK